MKPDRKLRPVTPQDVEDWKNQCGRHKMKYVANFLEVHHDQLEKKVNGYKCDLSNPDFKFKPSCKFCPAKLTEESQSQMTISQFWENFEGGQRNGKGAITVSQCNLIMKTFMILNNETQWTHVTEDEIEEIIDLVRVLFEKIMLMNTR